MEVTTDRAEDPLAGLAWQVMPAVEFEAKRADWDQLAAGNLDIPFLRSDFILPLLREFGTGRERLILGTDKGEPAVAALVHPTKFGAWQTFQPSQLPLGAIVGRPGMSIASMSVGLLRALPGWVMQLGLTQLDPRLFARPGDDARIHSLDYIETAWLDVHGDFESYWEARGKNLKQNMAKQRRKLQADGITTSLDVLTSPDDVLAGLRDYASLESAGWKAGGGTAIRLEEPQGRFFAAMLSAFSRRGAARVYRYCFNERPVAVDLCIESGGLQVVLKTTYDETLKGLSPAFLMRQDVLAMEWPAGRLARIEFYGKRLEWHQRWTDNVRVIYHLNAHRWPWINRWRMDRAVRANAVSDRGDQGPAPQSP